MHIQAAVDLNLQDMLIVRGPPIMLRDKGPGKGRIARNAKPRATKRSLGSIGDPPVTRCAKPVAQNDLGGQVLRVVDRINGLMRHRMHIDQDRAAKLCAAFVQQRLKLPMIGRQIASIRAKASRREILPR